MHRQIILDTETTGLDTTRNHKIIEIGCIEIVDRKYTGKDFHFYLNPKRKIDQGAINIHGITNEFLEDKPLFADIKDDLFEFINGSELIIHNAPFDVGFIEHEYKLANHIIKLAENCNIFDTLVYARKLHPGQKNSLDALCKRFGIDLSRRSKHNALLDCELLREVYINLVDAKEPKLVFPNKVEAAIIDNDGDYSKKIINISERLKNDVHFSNIKIILILTYIQNNKNVRAYNIREI